jgi:cyanophycinase
MLITGGNQMEAIGSGLVIIIDGHEIKHSNVEAVKEGSPLSVENLKVHFCEKGNGYLLKERKYLMNVTGKETVKS